MERTGQKGGVRVEKIVEVKGWRIRSNGSRGGNPTFQLLPPPRSAGWPQRTWPEIEVVVRPAGSPASCRWVALMEYEISFRVNGYAGRANRLYARIGGDKWVRNDLLLVGVRSHTGGRCLMVELPERFLAKINKISGETIAALPAELRPKRLSKLLEAEFGSLL